MPSLKHALLATALTVGTPSVSPTQEREGTPVQSGTQAVKDDLSSALIAPAIANGGPVQAEIAADMQEDEHTTPEQIEPLEVVYIPLEPGSIGIGFADGGAIVSLDGKRVENTYGVLEPLGDTGYFDFFPSDFGMKQGIATEHWPLPRYELPAKAHGVRVNDANSTVLEWPHVTHKPGVGSLVQEDDQLVFRSEDPAVYPITWLEHGKEPTKAADAQPTKIAEPAHSTESADKAVFTQYAPMPKGANAIKFSDGFMLQMDDRNKTYTIEHKHGSIDMHVDGSLHYRVHTILAERGITYEFTSVPYRVETAAIASSARSSNTQRTYGANTVRLHCNDADLNIVFDEALTINQSKETRHWLEFMYYWGHSADPSGREKQQVCNSNLFHIIHTGGSLNSAQQKRFDAIVLQSLQRMMNKLHPQLTAGVPTGARAMYAAKVTAVTRAKRCIAGLKARSEESAAQFKAHKVYYSVLSDIEPLIIKKKPYDKFYGVNPFHGRGIPDNSAVNRLLHLYFPSVEYGTNSYKTLQSYQKRVTFNSRDRAKEVAERRRKLAKEVQEATKNIAEEEERTSVIAPHTTDSPQAAHIQAPATTEFFKMDSATPYAW